MLGLASFVAVVAASSAVVATARRRRPPQTMLVRRSAVWDTGETRLVVLDTGSSVQYLTAVRFLLSAH